jgi:hypothetical protein
LKSPYYAVLGAFSGSPVHSLEGVISSDCFPGNVGRDDGRDGVSSRPELETDGLLSMGHLHGAFLSPLFLFKTALVSTLVGL